MGVLVYEKCAVIDTDLYVNWYKGGHEMRPDACDQAPVVQISHWEVKRNMARAASAPEGLSKTVQHIMQHKV